MTSLSEAAASYASHGRAIFPIKPRDKTPLTQHGLKAATTDLRLISEWWSRSPESNIGFATGDLIVLDVDGPEGEDALTELETVYGKLPPTREAKTGKGRHLYFRANGASIRNSASKVGRHLDIRGQGGYVLLPPSIHPNGSAYAWVIKIEPAPLPAWLATLLAERPQSDTANMDGKIGEGRRNQHLASLAGTMRRRDMSQPAIEKALLEENRLRCDPPLPEREVLQVAASVARYEPAPSTPSGPPGASAQPTKPAPADPWVAESMAVFLSGEESGAEFLDAEKRVIARASITSIFSPRGLGKSLYTLWLALACALRGLRVLLLDRDNPRHVVRGRLQSFGAQPETKGLKVITREKCPPLTNASAWATFPYAEYDLVILDSLDSAAEGIGEQDSSKPSKAIAPLLDIARRENGPAVLILGNTIKTAQHSRGSGVIEDRNDIVYEVRDATDFHPTGSKPWVEELPPADAGSWAGRSSRRKQRETYRLAFVSSKFRIGPEPEPFILEINTSVEPWTVKDVTNEVDLEGAEVREQRATEKRERIARAADVLRLEIGRRAEAGSAPMAKRRDAEGFLVQQGLNRSEARECLETGNGTAWVLSRVDGRTIAVLPVECKKEENGHISTPAEPTKIKAAAGTECGGSVSMQSATFDTDMVRQNSGHGDSENVAEDSLFTPTPETETVAEDEEVTL